MITEPLLRSRSRSQVATACAFAGAVLLALAACSSKSGGSSSRSGAELYGVYCAACHGKDGRGNMNLGSSYAGIARHWDEASLLEYIADPQAFAANVDRLGARPMTAIPDDVSPEDRQKIVQHALSLMD